MSAQDAFGSDLDYLWRAVGEAQDASDRSEKERAEARRLLEQAAGRAAGLERRLADSLAKERAVRAEAEQLRAALRSAEEAVGEAAARAAELTDLRGALRRRENEAVVISAELEGLRAEARELRETLAGRDSAIEALKRQMAGIASLPAIAKALKEETRLSGRQPSVYEYLLGRLEESRLETEKAAAELAAGREKEAAAGHALAAAQNELTALRAELAVRRQSLSALENALAEAAAKQTISTGEKAALEGRAAALKTALAGKETALEAALKDLASLRGSLDAAKIETERLRLAADEHALRAQEQAANFSGAVAQVFELQKKASALRGALAEAQEKNAAAAAELKSREADIEKVNLLLREAKGALGQEKEISRRAQVKIKTLEGDLEGLKAKLAEASEYSGRLLRAIEERDLKLGAQKAEAEQARKREEALALENEDLRRRNIRFSGLLLREHADFTAKMLSSLEKTVKDLKTFNLRIPAAERKALEPGLKNLLSAQNLLKAWQEYLDPETPDFEDTDLAGFVRAEASKWERAFKQRKISVSASIQNPRLRARLAPERVKLAFYQLVKNAYERLQPGGSLRISLKASEDGRSAVIAFDDTGPGFAREALDKLFAPFNTTDKGKAGIGLAVANRVAEKHGGALAVVNKPSAGALVELRLPLGSAAPTA